MAVPMLLSVITPSRGDRPKALAQAGASLEAALRQAERAGLAGPGQVEWLVGFDGVKGQRPAVGLTARFVDFPRSGNFGNTIRDGLIKLAKGSHLLFLDDDNALLPTALVSFLPHLDQELVIARIDVSRAFDVPVLPRPLGWEVSGGAGRTGPDGGPAPDGGPVVSSPPGREACLAGGRPDPGDGLEASAAGCQQGAAAAGTMPGADAGISREELVAAVVRQGNVDPLCLCVSRELVIGRGRGWSGEGGYESDFVNIRRYAARAASVRLLEDVVGVYDAGRGLDVGGRNERQRRLG